MPNQTKEQDFLADYAERISGRRPAKDNDQQTTNPTPALTEATQGQVFSDPTRHYKISTSPHSPEPESPTPPGIFSGENQHCINKTGEKAADLPQDASKGEPEQIARQERNHATQGQPGGEKGNPSLAEQKQDQLDKRNFPAPDITAMIDAISNAPEQEKKQTGQEGKAKQEPAKPRLLPTPISKIKSRPFPVDCIDGILPRTGVAVLGGASGDGKSFLAMDMGAHIVFKLAWFGRKVDKARPVCYFYLENPDGIKQRVLAWEKQNGKEITDDCGYSFFEVSLNMDNDVEELAQILPIDCVLIIDTLRKANPEQNENTPEGMGRILARMDTLCHLRRDLLIVVVHHVPKSTTQAADSRNKLAGHYSLPADTDAVLLTERKANDDRYLWIGKSRESEDGAGFSYALRKHQVGERPDGQPVTSLAVEWTGYAGGAASRKQKMGEAEKYARQALIQLQDMTGSDEVSFEEWQQTFSDMYTNDNPKDKNEEEKKYLDRIRNNFNAGKKKLLNEAIKIENGKTVKILKSLE